MPYTIKYNDDEGIVSVIYSGVATDDDLLNSLKEKTNSLEIVKNCKFSINDFTEATGFEATPKVMREMSLTSIELSKISSQIMPIIIAPKDIEFGMFRMWLAYIDRTKWDARIVRSYKEALDLMNEKI
ncbi:MAG: hypothetical protein HQ498_03215 [Pseudohongiella sp.]|nr:hypothetical protein [Pseudohongiella sp.]